MGEREKGDAGMCVSDVGKLRPSVRSSLPHCLLTSSFPAWCVVLLGETACRRFLVVDAVAFVGFANDKTGYHLYSCLVHWLHTYLNSTPAPYLSLLTTKYSPVHTRHIHSRRRFGFPSKVLHIP